MLDGLHKEVLCQSTELNPLKQNTMRDFQTWLIRQVMVTRGAACQVISELAVCPDCTVYTSQAAEQDNKTHT